MHTVLLIHNNFYIIIKTAPSYNQLQPNKLKYYNSTLLKTIPKIVSSTLKSKSHQVISMTIQIKYNQTNLWN